MLPCTVSVAAVVLPTALWYRAAFAFVSLLAPFLATGSGPLPKARLLNRMLALFTRTGRAFPIPWTASGLDHLPTQGETGGIVLCSAHVPLIKVALRALLEMGIPLTAAIAAEPADDGNIALWGLRERLPALRVEPNVLVKSRTVLRHGGTIVILADSKAGVPYSEHIFHLAGKTGARVLFFFAELQPGGNIAVRFTPPPDPLCLMKAGVQANLDMLDSEVRRILRQPYETCSSTQPASVAG